jgi:CubicO group peptidase (beta-lactamase class C family)
LNKGRVNGQQVVPSEWIDDIRGGGPVTAMEGAPLQKVYEKGTYRNQWWVSGDDSGCFYGVGIHGQYLWIDPSSETVIVKFSSRPEAVTLEANDFHARFFAEVAGALTGGKLLSAD